MGVFYPQAAVQLKIRLEDFGEKNNKLLQDTHDVTIQAKRITVNINDYKQADTFNLEIDYRDFPFDPRSIRACGVTIYMENMQSLGKLIKPIKANSVFVGWADEESITFDDSKRIVKLEGRDFTALLIDRKYSRGTVDTTLRVDKLLQKILDELPENAKAAESSRIKLDNRVEGALPILASFWDKEPLSGKKNVKKDETYWEVIQDIVTRAGLIAYIELDKLVLSKPRVLYDSQKRVTFIYGSNLKNLEFKRKIGRRKNFNIVVRSLNIHSSSEPVLQVQIPKDATAAWAQATGIPNVEVKQVEIQPDGTPLAESDAKPASYVAFLIPDVKSRAHLVEIGEQLYEEIGRQQIEGSLETMDMSSIEVNDDKSTTGTEYNLLSLRCGTPLNIKIDQGDLKGFNDVDTSEAKTAFLIARGYRSRIAGALVESQLRLKRFKQPFYTKSVQYTLDAESGFKCKIEFLNFIEVPKALAGKL